MPKPPGRRKSKRRLSSRSSPPPPQTSTPTIIRLLPPEILHQICNILPLPDLGNLRLTCKIFSELSQRHLVSTLHAMYTTKSLSNLLEISRHAKLKKYVRKIVYEPMMLEDMEREEWMGCMKDIFLGNCECDECEDNLSGYLAECDVVSGKLEAGWKEYKKMLDRQRMVRGSSYDIQTFKDSLSLFQALEEVVLNGRPSPKRSPWLERAYRDTLAIEGELTDGCEDGAESCVLPLLGLTAGLYSAQKENMSMKSLKLRSIGWSFFDTLPTESYMVFSQLRTLQLRLAEDFDEAEYENESLERHKNLGKAVQLGAKQLESLDLAFGHQTEYEELIETERETRVNVLWENIFSNKHFPKLHTLRLQNVTCHAEAMSSFFKAHASTLRVINLKSLWLHEPTLEWSSVFETMRQHLSLEKLFLEGYFGGEPTPDQPNFVKLGEHGSWLTKAIVHGNRITEVIKKKNQEAMEEKLKDWRKRTVLNTNKPCPHEHYITDPVWDLQHYANSDEWPGCEYG